jgi:TonB family protein
LRKFFGARLSDAWLSNEQLILYGRLKTTWSEMEFPGKRLLKALVEHDPTTPEFRGAVQAALSPAGDPARVPVDLPEVDLPEKDGFGLWKDVFVQQELPWGRFLQSAFLHATAVALIWTISLAWIRQQKILERSTFDPSSLVTYTPEELLPRLDTGATEAPKKKGEPVYAKQPILSVPREADNGSQTIVVPPELKLSRDVPLPNIIATGEIAPTVPLDATRTPLTRMAAPETQVVAPAPEVDFAADRVVRTAMKSEVIAPPPELSQSTRGHVGPMNIVPSEVVAPAPQLTVEAQHTQAARGGGHLPAGSVQPVGPPPSVAAAGSARAGGRLIALGIHPVAPTGPVVVPAGNRRGQFSASPQGKAGAAGTPDVAGSNSNAKGAGGTRNAQGSLPAGIHVGGSADDTREMASVSPSGARPGSHGARVASPVADDKITDVDRKVFGGKRVYGRTLNMPNLNSSTGSWIIKFAELDGGRHDGDLLEPVATEKPDPGYPLELIRANVHGMVRLYAVIHADGKVSDIRVISSPDDRLDSYAAKALAGWKFVPAERAGKPVALEAVVEIPFRVKSNF